MYKITCEQLQQVHENCAHSRNKVLASGRNLASFKWLGRLYHMIAPLKTAALSSYAFALLLFTFNKCFSFKWKWYFHLEYWGKKMKNEKMANQKLRNLRIWEILFQVFSCPNFPFCPIAETANSDLKNFPDFRDFRGFWVFDLYKD